MKDVRLLKQLQSQYKKMESEAEALQVEVTVKQRELSLKKTEQERLKERIKELDGDNQIKVSEHALIRYFERVRGYDLSEIEKEIVSEEVLRMVDTLGGTGRYPNKDYSVVMKNFTVTTIITNKNERT